MPCSNATRINADVGRYQVELEGTLARTTASRTKIEARTRDLALELKRLMDENRRLTSLFESARGEVYPLSVTLSVLPDLTLVSDPRIMPFVRLRPSRKSLRLFGANLHSPSAGFA